MVILKRFTLLTAVLAIASCATGTDQYGSDDYYADDYAMAIPVEKNVSTSKANSDAVVKASKTTPRTEAVAQIEPANKYTYAEQKTSAISESVVKVENSVLELKQAIEQNKEAFAALKAQSAEKAAVYYELVAKINARLQIGTTPGNPELTEMWKQASAALTEMGDKIQEMKILSSDVNKLSAHINALLNNISKTYTVPGALESDHERLKSLEDETNLTAVLQKRLASEISEQVTRQMQAFKNESAQISTLAVGIRNGKPYNPDMSAAMPMGVPSMFTVMDDEGSLVSTAKIAGRRPLMVIRFDREKVAFEQPLYQAVKTALDKRPNTDFELVAVSPAKALTDEAALDNAEKVRDSLVKMGLPSSRILTTKMVNASAKTTEVQLYLK